MHRTWPRVLACGVLLAILLPRAARSKTIDIDMSVPPVVASSASKADAAIATDANVLQRLFQELHDGSQAGRVEAHVAGIIATELVARGFDVAFGADGTEVVATSSNGPGPVLMYRLDTGSDRLLPPRQAGPIEAGAEATLPSHRCGHDVAITWMLGMARALTALRDDWSGTLVLVSQPTRRLGGMPSLKPPGAEGRRIPRPGMVLAMSAAPSPLGSILSVRGQRRAGSETAEVVMSRIGAYEAPRHAERVASLAASTTRLYGLPENAIFGYLLVGTARREPNDIGTAEIEATELDAAGTGATSSEPGVATSALDLASIPLGTKLATVAVLELLDRSNRARSKSAPAVGRGWTLHHY